jgi:hypothetical protein
VILARAAKIGKTSGIGKEKQDLRARNLGRQTAASLRYRGRLSYITLEGDFGINGGVRGSDRGTRSGRMFLSN